MTRWATLVVGLLAFAFLAFPHVNTASGQAGDGWITLLDGKTMGDWDQVGESQLAARGRRGGRRQADQQGHRPPGQQELLQGLPGSTSSSGPATTPTAASSCAARTRTKITDRTCYEANIFDQRKDPTYGTGGIVHFAEVNPMPKAGGKWNTYEITAKGRQITVMLNGQKTAELHNGLFVEGPITLQHGAGVMKFRKVAIKPL